MLKWLRRLLLLALLLIAAFCLAFWLSPVNKAISENPRQTAYLDMHVHVAGLGKKGSGNFVGKEMLENIRFPIFLRVMNVSTKDLEEKGDQILVERLSQKLGQSKRVSQAVILALDGIVNRAGQLDRDATQVYVSNEFVAEQAARFENLLFGASINPYRKDAIERLEWAKQNGAVLIKWIPPIMGINPSDERIIPFYKKMIELDLPLLSHAGQERSFGSAIDALGDPLYLELPLQLGVTVIAAHIATTGTFKGQDSYQRILPLFQRYPNLYSEISSLTQLNKRNFLADALSREGLTDRLIYGTDWPLQFFPLVHSVYHLPHIGWEKARAVSAIENQWDRDVALKEAFGVPEEVFERSRFVIKTNDM